ncbi:FMN reductase [Isoptericola aurantiacus]|uniref:FMN reductase n=1 Tax=Isoptericola aurantiacus TaxID=3377839 RepID=UPI003839F77A
MSTHRTLAVVTAGLSQPSSTRLLADRLSGAAADALREQGQEVDVEVVELREHAHAVVDAMLTGFPAGELAQVLQTVTSADGLIMVSPLFTTTYSGLFKSFVDVLDPDALTGKPVLLGATGGTQRHSLALDYSMRPLLTYLRTQVMPTAVFAATDDWAGQTDAAALPRRIARAGRELADAVAARPAATAPDDPFGDTPDFARLLDGGR